MNTDTERTSAQPHGAPPMDTATQEAWRRLQNMVTRALQEGESQHSIMYRLVNVLVVEKPMLQALVLDYVHRRATELGIKPASAPTGRTVHVELEDEADVLSEEIEEEEHLRGAYQRNKHLRRALSSAFSGAALAQATASVQLHMSLTVLDTYLVNGQPIGDIRLFEIPRVRRASARDLFVFTQVNAAIDDAKRRGDVVDTTLRVREVFKAPQLEEIIRRASEKAQSI